MKIYKTTLVFTDYLPGQLFHQDTIEWKGRFWLVPEWLSIQGVKAQSPTRLICLDPLPHQKVGSGFLLNKPIPKCVLDGKVPEKTDMQFVIVESPDIVLEVDS